MKYLLRYYKLFLWSLVIAYLCFAPASEFKKVHITLPHFDKCVHFGMFFIAGIFINALSTYQSSKFQKIWLPLFFVFYAALIEVIQHLYVYNRNGDIFDWLADVVGLFFGILFCSLLPNTIKKILS